MCCFLVGALSWRSGHISLFMILHVVPPSIMFHARSRLDGSRGFISLAAEGCRVRQLDGCITATPIFRARACAIVHVRAGGIWCAFLIHSFAESCSAGCIVAL